MRRHELGHVQDWMRYLMKPRKSSFKPRDLQSDKQQTNSLKLSLGSFHFGQYNDHRFVRRVK